MILNNLHKLLFGIVTSIACFGFGYYSGYKNANLKCEAKNNIALISNQNKEISILKFQNQNNNILVNEYESTISSFKVKYEKFTTNPTHTIVKLRNVPTTCGTTMPTISNATKTIDATAQRCSESFIFKCKANSAQLDYLERFINNTAKNWNETYK